MDDYFKVFDKAKDPLSYAAIKISLASPDLIEKVVLRGGKEAGNDKLPHLQTGAGRALLRKDFWARKRTMSASAASTNG